MGTRENECQISQNYILHTWNFQNFTCDTNHNSIDSTKRDLTRAVASGGQGGQLGGPPPPRTYWARHIKFLDGFVFFRLTYFDYSYQLPKTLRLRKNVSQNNFCDIVLDFLWAIFSYVSGVSVCIFVAFGMFGCLLQEPIRLKVLWVDA